MPKIEAMNIYIQYSMNTTEARQCLERSIKEHKPLASFLKSIEKTGFDPLDSLLQLPLTKLDHYMMFVEVRLSTTISLSLSLSLSLSVGRSVHLRTNDSLPTALPESDGTQL